MTQTPKRKLKAGDPVMLSSGLVTKLTDIQYEHNRYQLLEAASGWQYGIENLQLADWETEARKWRREALRQYPTPEAYEAACAALEKHRTRADTAEDRLHALQIVANAETRRADRWRLAVKEFNDLLNAAEAREQRLKAAAEKVSEIFESEFSNEEVVDAIKYMFLDLLSTLYPDTPAPKERKEIEVTTSLEYGGKLAKRPRIEVEEGDNQ